MPSMLGSNGFLAAEECVRMESGLEGCLISSWPWMVIGYGAGSFIVPEKSHYRQLRSGSFPKPRFQGTTVSLPRSGLVVTLPTVSLTHSKAHSLLILGSTAGKEYVDSSLVGI